MKQCNRITLLPAAFLIVSLCLTTPAPIQAAKKPITFRYTAIQKGKSYQVTDLLQQLSPLHEKARKLRNQIRKKKTKYQLSGKGITIKKNRFQIKKAGQYKLKLKANKKTYYFLLDVVNKTYGLDAEQVSYVTIDHYNPMPMQTPSPKLEDPTVIRALVAKLNQTKYKFQPAKPLGYKTIGVFSGYRIIFYDKENNCYAFWWLSNTSLEERCEKYLKTAPRYQLWTKTYHSLQHKYFYQYVTTLYDSMVPQTSPAPTANPMITPS